MLASWIWISAILACRLVVRNQHRHKYLNFITKDNTDYYLTIPADIVKGKTSGLKNGEIVIHFSVQHATGINDVDAAATVTGVYDLSGRKVSGVGIKGIVVKKLSNGKTVKVLQK